MSVFISYSHKDENEKSLLTTHLSVLEHAGRANVWVDDKIGPGSDWEADVRQAIDGAKVGVLLVTANFLASKFISSREVPLLLEKRRGDGLVVYPIIAHHCAWKEVDWLARMNVRPKNGAPVWRSGSDPDEALAEIAGEIAALLKNKSKATGPPPVAPRQGTPSVQAKSAVSDAISKALKAQLEVKIEQFARLNEQLTHTTGADQQVVLERKIEKVKKEMTELEAKSLDL